MKRCTKCILPETFPGIKFDDQGVCNFCRQFKGADRLNEDKALYLQKFKDLIAQVKDTADYDCTLSYSGGKDSTYTLYVLREIFNLKVLTLTLDNGFISDQAFVNIRAVSERLGADNIIFKPDFNLLKKLFRNAAENEMYSAKTLERASTICTTCIGLVKFSFLKIALEKRIPMMAWGWSPGQAPIRSSIMKINPMLFKQTQKALLEPMRKAAGDEVERYFLKEEQFKDKDAFPYNISPLAFMDYNENKLKDKIKEFGWKDPKDVDSNSTNCLLNSLANKIHIEKYGFHPYAFEIAGMVRTGVMDREEGIDKVSTSGNPGTECLVKDKLGLVI